MKIKGNMQATASVIYGRQIFQETVPSNDVSLNSVALDCNNGNIQKIDLSNSTDDVTVNLLNFQNGTYVFSFKQHPTTVRSITFDPVIELKWDLKTIGINETSVLVLHYNEEAFTSTTITSDLTDFSDTTNYGIGANVIFENQLFQSTEQVNASAFDISKWKPITVSTAENTSYNSSDENTTGTSVQSVIDYIISRPNLKILQYVSIEELINRIADHDENTLCYVENTASGAILDSTRTSGGFAYYVKNRTGGTITSYDVIGQFSQPGTRISFDNSTALLDNSPQNVQIAIEELKLLIDAASTGNKFINVWDASVNERFLADDAWYDSENFNPTILSWNSSTNTATIDSSEWISDGVIISPSIRVIHPTTAAIIVDTTITNSVIGPTNTTITLSNGTGVIQGHKLITADKRAASGDHFIVNVEGTSSIDGKDEWDVSDRIQSNGLIWTRIASNSISSEDVTVIVETVLNDTLPNVPKFYTESAETYVLDNAVNSNSYAMNYLGANDSQNVTISEVNLENNQTCKISIVSLTNKIIYINAENSNVILHLHEGTINAFAGLNTVMNLILHKDDSSILHVFFDGDLLEGIFSNVFNDAFV